MSSVAFVCMSVSVCPVRDLALESLDLELGARAPAVPGTKLSPRRLRDVTNTNSGGH